MENYNDYLQHWGILGMHWGDRNGPPYPLGSRQMTKEQRQKMKTAELERRVEIQKQRANDLRLRQEEKDLKAANREARAKLRGRMTLSERRLAAKEREKEKLEIKQKTKDLEKENRLAEKRLHGKKIKDPNDARILEKTNPKKLTDDQLNSAIKRRQAEKQLRDLNAGTIANGKKFIGGIISTSLSNIITSYFGSYTKTLGEKFGSGKATEQFENRSSERRKRADYEEAVKTANKTATSVLKPEIEKINKSGGKDVEQVLKYERAKRALVDHFLQENGYKTYYGDNFAGTVGAILKKDKNGDNEEEKKKKDE